SSQIIPCRRTRSKGSLLASRSERRVILATQKKMISCPVSINDRGTVRSDLSRNQSVTASGRRADENQVSRTSLSCLRSISSLDNHAFLSPADRLRPCCGGLVSTESQWIMDQNERTF